MMRGFVRAQGIAAVVALTALVLSGCTVAASPDSARTVDARTETRDAGALALEDLRSCLAGSDTLNVMYLVDNSGSIRTTDPKKLRADVLAGSLRELGSLRDGVTVNWAAAAFSSGYSRLSNWKPLDAGSDPDQLGELVLKRPGGETNWKVAVESAERELLHQTQLTPGCSALIWFTDGAIKLGSDNVATEQAATDLCGAPLTTGGTKEAGGILQRLRTEQIVVLGVLLNQNTEDLLRKSYLRPMVEATGELSDGTKVSCGKVGGTDVHGAVFEAASAESLAIEFAKLAALLDGGSVGEINAAGHFAVPAGVTRFAIQFDEPRDSWTLSSPNSTYTSFDPGPVTPLGDDLSTGFEVSITDPTDHGEWTIDSPDGATLYRYSGLRLQLATAGEKTGAVEGEQLVIHGRVQAEGVSINDYSYEWRVEERVEHGSDPRFFEAPTIVGKAGEFELVLDPSGKAGSKERIVFSLTALETKDGSIPLAPVVGALTVSVVNGEELATASSPITLDAPSQGPGKPATGTFTVAPAADGSVAKVSIPTGQLKVTSDRLDRQGQFDFEATSLSDGCTSTTDDVECGIASEEEFATTIRPASDSAAGYSDVEAVIPIIFTTADGISVERDIPVRFSTERPINGLLLALSVVVLLLLGFAIPVVLARIVRLAVERIVHGKSLLRAEFSVMLSPTGVVGIDDELSSGEIGTREFRTQSAVDRVASISDPTIGELTTHVPWSPLRNVWFEISPRGDDILIAPDTVVPTEVRARMERGEIATFDGSMARLWVLVIPRAELLDPKKPSSLRGKLVVFHNRKGSDRKQYSRRMVRVLHEAKVFARLLTVRQLLMASPVESSVSDAQTTHEPQRHEGAAPPPDAQKRPSANAGEAPPPPRLRSSRGPSSLPSRTSTPGSVPGRAPETPASPSRGSVPPPPPPPKKR
jgi:hypothetical protein